MPVYADGKTIKQGHQHGGGHFATQIIEIQGLVQAGPRRAFDTTVLTAGQQVQPQLAGEQGKQFQLPVQFAKIEAGDTRLGGLALP